MSFVSPEELIQLANNHHVVSFPTDTVPALAVKPDHAHLIYELKQRSPDKPLILMAASLPEIWDYVVGTDAEKTAWQAIAEQYFPGALTLVLPASEKVCAAMNPTNSGTIGVRIPDLAVAQQILARTGVLATTSANLSGQVPLEFTADIARSFPEVAVLDCQKMEQLGKIGSGQPSTVVQWNAGIWQVLRQGAITLKLQVATC